MAKCKIIKAATPAAVAALKKAAAQEAAVPRRPRIGPETGPAGCQLAPPAGGRHLGGARRPPNRLSSIGEREASSIPFAPYPEFMIRES